MAAWTTGARLGPYVLLEPIGAGGMGEVWKARDTRLDRIVAIKASKEQFSERFEREARAVAALNHPHICQLYDVGPNYLVMEFIEGAPLKGPLAIEKAVEYAGQILEALDAAHRKGITHRDLKPANILVTKQGIKLLDFGLAKQAGPIATTDDTLTQGLTQRGEIVGTLQYMSPEQLQGKDADARSDLFAFGCVLYEMLTGKRAFEGESAASVIAAILEREPAPLTAAPPLERVVRRGLAKDPDQRFQTARDLKAAMTWAMEEGPSPVAAKPGGRWWWIGAAALVIGGLGGWAVAHLRETPTEDRVVRLQINPPEGGQFVLGGGGIGDIALSPDGRTAAYVAVANGKIGLWVRALDGSTARLIAGTEGAGSPFWSPDGKSLAFFTGSKLQRVDLSGGTPSPICDLVGRGRGTWSADGRILFAGRTPGLFAVPASGGTPSPLTAPDASRGEIWYRHPQVLPNGRFLFFVRSGKPENTGVYAASLARPGDRTLLLRSETNAVYTAGGDGKDYLLWLRGETLVAQEFDAGTLKLSGELHPLAEQVGKSGSQGLMEAAVSAGGTLLYSTADLSRQFTWFDRKGTPMGKVGEAGEYNGFRLSPDGRRIAVTNDRPGDSGLWLVEVERGIANRFSNSGISAVWSPDGQTIVFFSTLTRNLIRKAVSGAGAGEGLTRANSTIVGVPTDWSRDGRWLLYHAATPDTGRDLWVLPVPPGGEPAQEASARPYIQTAKNEWNGRFSPESPPRWVVYQSDDTDRSEIYVQTFPVPRGPIRISNSGGQFPQWGADGHELFYVSLDNKLMAVKVELGADSVEPATPRELFPLPALETGQTPYEVAPDGQRFLVRATPGQAGQPLTVIVNWPALLKRGAAAQ